MSDPADDDLILSVSTNGEPVDRIGQNDPDGSDDDSSDDRDGEDDTGDGTDVDLA